MRSYHPVLSSIFSIIFISIIFSCETPEPVKEATPETITRLRLIFTPDAGESIVVEAIDPDAEGVQEITATDSIRLFASRHYELQVQLFNELVEPAAPEFDVTVEIEEEGVEHLLLYAWTDGAFDSPSGDGNIDARADEVIYLDADDNGLPLGLLTGWTTKSGGASLKGNFRIVLKHQPDLKSENSGMNTGETDLDFTFPLRIN